MKDRNTIEDKYKWNLQDIYASDEDFEKEFDEYKSLTKDLDRFKGKLSDIDTLLEYLHLDDEIELIGGKIGLYVFLKRDLDISSSKAVEMMDRVNNYQNKVSEITSFVEPEILQFTNEYLEEIYSDDRFKDYKLAIHDIVRCKNHILDEKMEALLTRIGDFASGFSDVYDNIESVDLTYKPIRYNGKKYELTQALYGKYRESNIREIRKQAYENMFNAYKDFSNTIATNYIYNVKSDYFFAKERRYNTCLEAEFDSRNLNPNIYSTLLNNVDGHLGLLHKYFSLMKKFSGLDDFTIYDTRISFVKDFNPKFTVEKSKKIVLDSLKILGKDYISILNEAFENRWIDYFETKNKASGGYQADVYGVHPFILLNYVPNFNSLSTLAHELGHCCHSYYSNKSNPISTASYNLFVAEIASTTNEILLLKHMIDNSKTDKEKLFYLQKFANDFHATVYTQTMYSKFEVFAHDTIENNGSLSKDTLCNYYGDLIKSFYGPALQEHELSKYSWLCIPHFYRCYYVYKYSTSYAVSSYVANRIYSGDKEFLTKYKEFLSSGGSKYPEDILKIIDVDLTKNTVYDIAFKDFEWSINEIEKLL